MGALFLVQLGRTRQPTGALISRLHCTGISFGGCPAPHAYARILSPPDATRSPAMLLRHSTRCLTRLRLASSDRKSDGVIFFLLTETSGNFAIKPNALLQGTNLVQLLSEKSAPKKDKVEGVVCEVMYGWLKS